MIGLRHRHLEIAAVVIAPCLAIWAIVIAASAIDLVGFVAALAGYVLADFFCGAIHWICDEVADPSWPVVGRAFIVPFRDHHENPSALTRHDVAELCGNNAIVTALILAAILPWAAVVPHLAIGIVGLAVGVLATNVFHKWAHMTSPPRVARLLQAARVVLSPAEHADHHETLDRAYCVTSGWTNPALDAMVSGVRKLRQRRSRWQRT